MPPSGMSGTRIFAEGANLTLGPRKWPRQTRAAATVDAILEATAQILERGDRFSTNRIAERAGVGIATLYQYFDSKEAVAAALSRTVREALAPRSSSPRRGALRWFPYRGAAASDLWSTSS